jgi:hypothetical protein
MEDFRNRWSKHMSSLTGAVRQYVLRTIDEAGIASPAIHSEALLCRNGYIVGRQFNLDGARAVWFLDEERIKIYRTDGTVLEMDFNQPRRSAV